MQRCLIAIGAAVVSWGGVAIAEDQVVEFKPPTYEILRAQEPLVIDGKLDEPAWIAAPSVGPFHFTWYKAGKREQTVAKLLWDDEYLYVGHICQDEHITARHTKRDGPISQDDCFEVMFAPNAEKPNVYFNIEWNVIGGYVDNHRPHGPKQPRAKVWDAQGVKLAGTFVGTLNNDDDRDHYWVAEVAIPFKNFQDYMPQTPPAVGTVWHLNLNRHGGDTNMQYSQWSPADTDKPSFHTPHRFGRVKFSTRISPFGRID